METLVIIPARGGSKSLPRKNVLPLCGLPLIAHNIRAALLAERVSRVVVSTDDAEIASIARKHGADVVVRPDELATDQASSESALLHALRHLNENEGYQPDLLCFLQCTSPLTEAEDIDGAINALLVEGADSALSVASFHYFLWQRDGEGQAIGVNHDKHIRQRRQDRVPEFLETGAIYVMKVPSFIEAQHRFLGKTVMYEMPAERVLEIDEPADFVLAEQRMSYLRRTGAAARLPTRIDGLVMDFDGVFTDDRVLVDQDGRESVLCSRRDGMGIELLRNAGIPMVVISKEKNAVVARRCEKLMLEHYHGIEAKADLLRSWLQERQIDPEYVVYIGNDINDVECMGLAGCSVAPGDAHESALSAADIILEADGGRGALRQLAEMILARKEQDAGTADG